MKKISLQWRLTCIITLYIALVCGCLTLLGPSLVIQSVLFLYRPKTLSDSDRTSLFFADSHQFFRQFL